MDDAAFEEEQRHRWLGCRDDRGTGFIGADGAQRGSLDAQQAVLDALEVLADDEQRARVTAVFC